VHALQVDADAWRVDVEGPSTGELLLGGLAPDRTYVVRVADAQGRATAHDDVTRADAQGRVTISVPLGGRRTIALAPGGAGAWAGGVVRRMALPVALIVLAALFLVRARLRADAALGVGR
jgi:hypothetical protein